MRQRPTNSARRRRQGGYLLVEILCATVVLVLVVAGVGKLMRVSGERDEAIRRSSKTQRYMRSYEEMVRYVPYETLLGSLDGTGNMVVDNGYIFEPFNYTTRTYAGQLPYKVKVLWTISGAGTADEFAEFQVCVCVTDTNYKGTGESRTTHDLSALIRRYPSARF